MSLTSKGQHYGQQHHHHHQRQQQQHRESPEFSPLGFSPLLESPQLMPQLSIPQPSSSRKSVHHHQVHQHQQLPPQYQLTMGFNSKSNPMGKSGYANNTINKTNAEKPHRHHESTLQTIAIENEEILPDDTPVNPIFNDSWLFNADYLHNRTPSRRDGISYEEEIKYRRMGTAFIADMARKLKLKPICKETATVYFHRFYMLRSFTKYSEKRIATVCLYLASKFEDNPMFKDYFIAVFCALTNKPLKKTDKEYIELCDRLIVDENLLLQVLGFNLQIKHSQVLIVIASQNPIEGTNKQFYANAYKIASEVNRLSMLVLQHSAPVLACITLYLAACYTKAKLPKGWTYKLISGAVSDSDKACLEEKEKLICKVGEEYRNEIARNSKTAQAMIQQYQAQNSVVMPSPQQTAEMGKAMSKASPMYQHILTSFSPDSAYSSSGGSVKSDTLSPPKLAPLNSSTQHKSEMMMPVGGAGAYGIDLNNANNHQRQQQQTFKRAYAETATMAGQQHSSQVQQHAKAINNNKRARNDPKQMQQHLAQSRAMMMSQQQQQQQQQQLQTNYGYDVHGSNTGSMNMLADYEAGGAASYASGGKQETHAHTS